MRIPTLPSSPVTHAIEPVLDTVLQPARNVVEPIRSGLADRISQTLRGPEADGAEAVDAAFANPPGDPGWFGPDSMVWRVHSDIPAMLLGGISALMLQTLHPLAMAGVAEHSDFKERPLGRLQRTASFIGTTTFGSTEAAEQACAIVHKVHTRVQGTAPDGRHYEANDPDLLTWVHVAEIGSFLRGYQRYSGRPLSPRRCDQYIEEVSLVAEKLGARNVPTSSAALREYFRVMRPQLHASAEAFDTIDFLVHTNRTRADEMAVYGLMIQGSIDLLPGWARRLLHLRHLPMVSPLVVRPSAFAMSGMLRWVMGPVPVREVAAQRAAA